MALTLDQFGNLGLTTGQKTKLQQCSDIGTSLRNATKPGAGGSNTPDISLVTLAQAKAVNNFMRDVNTLLGPMSEGAKYVRDKILSDASKATDAASPPSTF